MTLAGGALLLALLLPAAAEAAPALTLERQSDELLEYKRSATVLTGQLTGVTLGNANRTVTLRASAFPYASQATIDSTTTDADGRFSFDIEPDFNTRYHAVFEGGIVLGSATSAPERVFVYARARSRLRVRRNRAIMRVTFLYSPEVEPDPVAGKPAFWYFRRIPNRRFRRVAKSRFRGRSQGGATAIVKYRLPRTRRGYRFEMFPCAPKPARDVGVGDRRRIRCPKRVRARAARAAVATSDDDSGGPRVLRGTAASD